MKLACRGTRYPLRREASRYAKQTGSRDSRITSRYAMMIFDRPPRRTPSHFLRIPTHCCDQNPSENKLKPLLTPLEAIVGDWKPLEHQREFLEATNKQDDPHQPSFELPEPVTPRI
ncbi:hypothetical protein E3N88_12076 [Mikania micrantha]|uniref:Uncharacterized protein n=1 Tax=Mikania micrantha TaxID=192012 RepID=A0A5N6P5U6_9ASTR|nr:hypothetical protein E3N88_12076 [Mikania micrantha]